MNQTKKILILNILAILQEETDVEHTLTQQQIIELLERNYGMVAGRKAVKRNLMDLVDFGFPIEYDTVRRGDDPETEPICTNWYYNHKITDAELRLLIDLLLSAKYIPGKQKQDLAQHLEGLSSKYFKQKVRHIPMFTGSSSISKQLFYTIDILDEAIQKNLKVTFHYGQFAPDKSIHKKTDRNGNSILYIVSPYQLAAQNGRYFLIANTDGHNDISHFRIDRILDIDILDQTNRIPLNSLPDYKNGLDIEKFMNEHINMLSGESVRVTFGFPNKYLDTVLDWFDLGELSISEAGDNYITATSVINYRAMKYWAIRYSAFIEVLEPANLRSEIGKALSSAAKKYQ